VIDEDFVLGLPAQGDLNKAYFPNHWDIDPLNARYMRRFLELAAAHKIPVFWVLPPIRVDYQAGRDKRGLDDLYLRRAYALFTRFPNLYLLDARHSGFPDAVFFDPSHLDRAGGLALSAAVARVIGSVLDDGENTCPRVVELPPYRAFALETPPEDLESSRERLGFSRMQPKRLK
jgi:hypothetical protein